jgi:predicted O-methyltransferase YrrM
MNPAEGKNEDTILDAMFESVACRPSGSQALDQVHALLLAGLVTSHKPVRTLELGIGSGYATRVILQALDFNRQGELLSVDNFFDWNGQKPEHVRSMERERPDWRVAQCDETEFLRSSETGVFDLILSDGDHTRGYQNAPDVFRVCKAGGLVVFHDTNNELFRLLCRLPRRCRQLRFPGFHFIRRSRPDEMTGRGLLVVEKDGSRRFTLDVATRIYLFVRRHLPESVGRWLRTKAVDQGRPG